MLVAESSEGQGTDSDRNVLIEHPDMTRSVPTDMLDKAAARLAASDRSRSRPVQLGQSACGLQAVPTRCWPECRVLSAQLWRPSTARCADSLRACRMLRAQSWGPSTAGWRCEA